VEIYFDGGNTKVNTPLSGDDHQYTFGWTADDIQGTNITGATEGIEQAQVTTDTGWRIEVKMPWLSIWGVVPQAGDLIGIDCYYNDDDDGGDSREGKMLSFSAVEGWNDASQWGTAILAAIPEPVDPGSEGLVAYYAMENDVLDGSGNGNDGTIVGNPTWIPGVQGTALEFHGLGAAGGGGDYIDCGSGASLDIAGPISIALWIRPDAEDPEGQGTETAPMAKAMSGISPWNWQVRYGWGSPQPYMAFTFNTSPRAWAYVGQNLAQGEWSHIACSHDGATLKCYLDGTETDSTPMGAIARGEAPVLIGSDGWGCDWIGAIDEVMIYDRDLSDSEVRYLAGERPAPIVLFEEDFEGLPLGPNVDEALAGDAVWTDTPPAGWIIDESGIPGIGDPTTDGVTEWAGWAFADKDWWIQTAGDQDRSLFTLGSGTVAIADPDEWDDADRIADPIADNPYDTWLSTPAIDISGVGAGTLQLVFDSSWRPEFDNNLHQTASITASYDGAEPVEVFLWESDEVSPNYKPYATNETVVVDLGNPEGATSVVLTFGLFDAGNDWWWAIDNVKVIAPPPAPVEADPSLSIYYTFDEVGETVADQSGKGHDGVVVGEITANAEGVLNGAAQFANGAYLDLDGLNFTLEDIPTSGMTLAAWIKCENTGDHHAIFNARASDQTWVVHPEARSNGEFRWLLRSYGGTTMLDIRAGAVTWGEWLHFAGTYDKASAKAALCINGELVAEVDVANPADIAGDWGLGARVGKNIDDARPLTGLMDEFRLLTRALSQDEIVDMMAGM